jgi:hypothetical protein
MNKRQTDTSEFMRFASIKPAMLKKSTIIKTWSYVGKYFRDYTFGQIMYLKKLFPGHASEWVKAIEKNYPVLGLQGWERMVFLYRSIRRNL